MSKVIEFSSIGLFEWGLQIFNILFIIAIIIGAVYLFVLIVKLIKKGIYALDLWIGKNK